MRRLLLTLAAAALLAACSQSSDNQSGGQAHPTAAPAATTAPGGTAAQGGAPSRTIQVAASDTLRFQPAAIQVKVGETVAFRVTNGGKLVHEFTIGDQAFHQKHEQEMQQMGGQPMADEANAMTVPAGQTKTLVYTFQQPGTLVFACHTSGHYQAGMKGTVTAAAA